MLLLKNATVYPQTEKAPFVGDVLCENGRIISFPSARNCASG